MKFQHGSDARRAYDSVIKIAQKIIISDMVICDLIFTYQRI